ncbi:hypothetical protein D9611_009173 [Ephemerocybe angulata]|uniref:Thioester reductase (TE) domain-containing protein n=1 Tax=Ephemerocybe angulata TaxID=980116 RepID=A0A8H5CFT5_9AGAR|nr:hypothetical protein D9611_009173 [Tulosesus angulatus]
MAPFQAYPSNAPSPQERHPQVGETKEKKMASMRQMVTKYTRTFPVHIPGGSKPTKESILLTGSTGTFGSYVLESLVQNPAIGKVYALNRPHVRETISSTKRQLRSFSERGINPNLDLSKVRFLEGDLATDNFGLEEGLIEEMKRNVTCIMHTAWRVDFNGGLASFEPLVAGTRNLVDFALSSLCDRPPRFLFASSMTVFSNLPEPTAFEIAVEDPSVAISTGYSESKWVAEQIVSCASEETTLSPLIIRLGQLSGGRNGYWTRKEWIPRIVCSSEYLGCLPQNPGVVSWLPIHVAAQAWTEVRACDEQFLTFAHTTPTSWNDMMKLISDAMSVRQVPYPEWVGRLEDSQSASSAFDVASNPAMKLLEFYISLTRFTFKELQGESFGLPLLSTDKAVKHAPSLHPLILEPLGRKDVEAWISYWKSAAHTPRPKL